MPNCIFRNSKNDRTKTANAQCSIRMLRRVERLFPKNCLKQLAEWTKSNIFA
ncbi:hypothetical protein HMPREF0653_01358 [Prevotella disiens JCM 6334 = ATCC 29426]|uniref:Uncharacterized protein n=1 Tax=Prevotella disiens JCM 6334 = ATCC 29426 TaxID=1235811 RepID=A0ABN0NS67_9BACT|nr:hypothetical protein HMPREF0653_01358 [Prevotella disiens JCM 6334 = ATCC 29426]